MDYIDCLIDLYNKKGLFEIRKELDVENGNDVLLISIRSFDFNGEAPIGDIKELISVMNEFRKKDPDCKFSIHSDIIQTKNVDSKIELKKCTFYKKVLFEDITFEKDIHLGQLLFLSEVKFTASVIKQSLLISSCVFEKYVSFKNACCSLSFVFESVVFKSRAYFNNVRFEGIVDFKDCMFESKVQFHLVKFKNIVGFKNSTFKSLVDFYCAEFHCPHIFHLTDFLDRAIFSNTIFFNQVSFIHCKTSKDSYINFESAVFHQSLDISRANFNCETNFWNITIINKTIIPSEFTVYQNDKHSNDIEQSISKMTLQKIRESYRIIKNSLRKSGNEIDALKFKSYEMKIYEKELNIGDKGKTILFFSKLSNQHGLSWGQGLCFTIFFAIITLYVFMLCSAQNLSWDFSYEARIYTLDAFIQILNVANWRLSLWGQNINSFAYGYVIVFIGRIFIGYGYYQMISAFRRFGKN